MHAGCHRRLFRLNAGWLSPALQQSGPALYLDEERGHHPAGREIPIGPGTTPTFHNLKKFEVPTLIIHGDDQIVPIGASALLLSKMVKGSTLRIYPGAPHGLCSTHKDQANADLLAFLKA